MSRVSIVNFLIGFIAIFLSACAGVFLSFDTCDAINHNQSILSSWSHILFTSSHGHTNLFGLLHIAFGVTLPYSKLTIAVKKIQTLFLASGTFSMSVLLYSRAIVGSPVGLDALAILSGLFLSLALVAIAGQCLGLCLKLVR